MSYQALLFCPDEKTARTVTQVLSELDFTVNPCTEPFAAVKKLMGERFDAVVVDCDNEQNATLLFKSARNAPNNQSALAVAVVEGQAGVAKAFRIGANLVLTKPINVEQAKGTLRVARGLLRKNEGAKPATPGPIAAAKPMASAPAPAKPAPPAAIPITRREAPIMPVVANIPAAKPAQVPIIVASTPIDTAEDSIDILDESGEQSTPATAPAIAERKSSSGFAASAPAPARESKPGRSGDEAAKKDLNEKSSSIPASSIAATAIAATSIGGTSAPATEFTFGGTVKSGSESTGGGSKKALLAVVATILVAAGGYFAWTQWGHSNGTASAPAEHVAAQPAPKPVPVPQAAPSPAPVPPPTASETRSADTQTGDTEAPDTQTIASTSKTPAHPSKTTAPSTSKPSPSAPKASKVVETSPDDEPMVIKNDHPKPSGKPAAAVDAPALSLTAVAPAGDAGALPNLMGESKAPTPVLEKLIVSQGVSRGLLVKQVQPVYPANALRMHTEGSVQMMATLSKSGDITDVKVLSGDRELARAAVDAVKKWKYKPYLLNGEPVDIQTQITVNFKLPH